MTFLLTSDVMLKLSPLGPWACGFYRILGPSAHWGPAPPSWPLPHSLAFCFSPISYLQVICLEHAISLSPGPGIMELFSQVTGSAFTHGFSSVPCMSPFRNPCWAWFSPLELRQFSSWPNANHVSIPALHWLPSSPSAWSRQEWKYKWACPSLAQTWGLRPIQKPLKLLSVIMNSL